MIRELLLLRYVDDSGVIFREASGHVLIVLFFSALRLSLSRWPAAARDGGVSYKAAEHCIFVMHGEAIKSMIELRFDRSIRHLNS